MSDFDPAEQVTLLIGSNDIGEPTSRSVSLSDAVQVIADLPTLLGVSAVIVRADGAHMHGVDQFMRLHRKFTGQEQ